MNRDQNAVRQEILGEPVDADPRRIPVPVDRVDGFRHVDAAIALAEAAIAIGAKILCLQIGVRDDAAAARAEAAGLSVVMNRCPKLEHSRLFGDRADDAALR